MQTAEQHPKVGVGVMVFKNGLILLHKRKGSHGAGEYSFPGGHLEYMEAFEDCARRETAEECGIEIENIQFSFLANVQTYAPKHYVHIGMIARWKDGEPVAKEPDKGEEWGWYSIDHLPKPLFGFCKLALRAWLKGIKYFPSENVVS